MFQVNLIQPVELKLTLHRLTGLNKIWEYADLFRDDLEGAYKMLPSILRQVAKKLKNKEVSRSLSTNKKKDFTMKLEVYEAKALEIYIRSIADHMHYGWELNVAANIANEINQKTA